MAQTSRIPAYGSLNQDKTSRILTNALLSPAVAASVSIIPVDFYTLVNFPTLNANMTVNAGIGSATQPPFVGDELQFFFANQNPYLAPGLPVLTGSTTGGTLAAASYFYKVTAINVFGETIASAEATVTTTGTTSSVGITWPASTGATSYRIYRGTATGAENVYYTSTTNAFTDTGAVNTAATPPASATYTVTMGTGIVVTAATLAIPAGKTGNITLVFNGAFWTEIARSVTI